ncbi:AAA domain-containing protein [Fusarium falciforme]|uniref:AAA domain-containing protein n=1 Tax=Fusarium falciforme TaxID=195108 RepID=UPI0023001085|nr:AAA domain-containing protein [Fusarium falciforme]WAO96666.1 AAA domain-containing protein [Fusarium falciforme]
MGDDRIILEEANSANGRLCEVMRLVEKEDDDGDCKITEKGPTDTEPSQNTYASYALVEKTFIKGQHTRKTLQINSQHICDTLEKLSAPYPQRPSVWKTPLHFDAPFQLLFHHQGGLAEERDAVRNDGTRVEQRQHLRLLLQYMDGELGGSAAEMVSRNEITFDLLWYVFRPGIYISHMDGDNEQILWLESMSSSRDMMMDFNGPSVTLNCLYTEYNGSTEGKSRKSIKVYEQHHFPGTGTVPINSLPACPLKCLSHGAKELTARMRERGKVCDELKREAPAARYYEGSFLAAIDKDGWKPQTTAGRVIIDPKAFIEENPTRQIVVSPWAKEGTNGPEQNILWPPYVYGYNLGTRQWGRFFIQQLSKFEYGQDLWPKVAMNEEQKKLLRSSVASHCTSPDLYDEGKLKGRGFVVLLHGVPGTGKTLTAVAIAEDIKKPLLLYPGGELGYRLDAIEGRIKKVVRLASRWGAILLIDEADVFLESRRSGGEVSLERNALIAVFLRQLEYSTGVIFLTSNRASKFDSAIKSRVHLTFRYSFPSFDTRRKIWEDLIKARTVDNADLLNSLEQVAKHAMDGREISNTLNSAIDLAKHRKESLGKRHLDVAVNAWEVILLSMLALVASFAVCIFVFLKDKKLVLVINS